MKKIIENLAVLLPEDISSSELLITHIYRVSQNTNFETVQRLGKPNNDLHIDLDFSFKVGHNEIFSCLN